MSRSKAIRSLPPIEKAFPDWTGFPVGQSRQHYLLKALGTLAKSLRKPQPQVFYPMREVARFFGAPLRTVALVYESLEKEGVLNRIRSSQTVLAGKENSRRSPIRSVIGIPIWMEMLVHSWFTRTVNMELEERFRKRGFVADLIFHSSKHDETHPEFAERLLQHDLDVVVWQNPEPKSHQNILSLRNHGIRILLVLSTEARIELPAIIYLQSWDEGHLKLIRHWKASGINKVLLPMTAGDLYYETEQGAFTSLLEKEGMPYEIFLGTPAELQRKCKATTKARLSIGFLATSSADRFCNHEPLIMEKLAATCMLAFCRGPHGIPYLEHRGIHPDVVGFSPIEMATKMSEDVQILPQLPDGVRHTFHAHLWLKGKLGNESSVRR
ncbi:MAG: hypothetical protein ACAI35_09020 [Candidatus Methylacidiphilales bacterium]|nr:hypothetical protein [Candidatus Methylacidiphilales bacterium]